MNQIAPDELLLWMQENGVELTRENYLDLAYMGDPPEELSAEEEVELPTRFQKKFPKREGRAYDEH